MKRFLSAAILLTSIAVTGVTLAQDRPESVQRGAQRFRQKAIVTGLSGPWEVTWGPDSMLWVTERTGRRVSRIDPVSGKQAVAITISEVSAPGGQDGLLGLALHPDLLKGAGNDYAYVAYTYEDRSEEADLTFDDPASPYRYLYMKIVRLAYDKANGALSSPVDLITGLPAGNDHNAGRLKIGPDRKLYLTIGDQGHNQLGNMCLPIEAQRLPTRKEIDDEDYAAYVGKSLRLNLDGSVPEDNPKLDGVVSHVYTYGHRNPQGIDFAPDATLYSTDHGPKTDDEVNILEAGSNYGWPHVAGLKDGMAYQYARWAEAARPCRELTFSDLAIHPSVPREPESAFDKPFTPPIATMFTVPSGYNFENPACGGVHYICWPTVGASSVEYYRHEGQGIPGWDKVLLVTTLKRGSLYVWPLDATGRAVSGKAQRYFQSENRFRDTAVSPDGMTIYVATDAQGPVESLAGGVTSVMADPGAILTFAFAGVGDPGEKVRTAEPPQVSKAAPPQPRQSESETAAGGPPQFTTEQAAAGKAAYNSNCAVCHGSNLTNGTMGTPLAGRYFHDKWFGRTVEALYNHARTMPPAAPGSLPPDAYADILAYVLQTNGFAPGAARLPPGGDALGAMAIR